MAAGQQTPRGVTSQNGNINIDQANNRIVINNTDGNSVILGVLPDGDFGLAFLDSSGYMVRKSNIITDFWYDKATDKNQIQNGLLPDGTYGEAVAKSGYNVSDGIA